MHAMVLEDVEEITEYNQSQGYEVGDHKLIFKNTFDSNEYGKEKRFTINARDEKSPDVFYYVHIDIELSLLQDVPGFKTISNNTAMHLSEQYVLESEAISNDPATPSFEVSEEPYSESTYTQCLNAFKSCFNC